MKSLDTQCTQWQFGVLPKRACTGEKSRDQMLEAILVTPSVSMTVLQFRTTLSQAKHNMDTKLHGSSAPERHSKVGKAKAAMLTLTCALTWHSRGSRITRPALLSASSNAINISWTRKHGATSFPQQGPAKINRQPTCVGRHALRPQRPRRPHGWVTSLLRLTHVSLGEPRSSSCMGASAKANTR